MKDFKDVLTNVGAKYLMYTGKYGRQWLDQPAGTLVDELLDEFNAYGESPEDDPEEYDMLCKLILKGLMCAERIRPKCNFTECDHGMGFAGRGGCPGEPTVILAEEGTIMAEFQKERTDAISEMFDNEGKDGIFTTTRFFARLDAAVERAIKRARSE